MNKWDSKRIAFVSILIAMSISFVVIGSQVAAISAFPTIKLSLAGLPIKIIGYIFGPLIGLITGFVTDILSFVFIPAFYYPLYSLSLGISGMVPGLVNVVYKYFYKKLRNENTIISLKNKVVLLEYKKCFATIDKNELEIAKYEKKIKKIKYKIGILKESKVEKKQLDFGFYSAIFVIIAIAFSLTLIVTYALPQSNLDEYFGSKGMFGIFKNKIYFTLLIWVGLMLVILITLVSRFVMKSKNFLVLAPIITFITITEYVNVVITSYADSQTGILTFLVSLIASLATSPIKLMFNAIIIYFAIKITMPLIEKKTNNGFI